MKPPISLEQYIERIHKILDKVGIPRDVVGEQDSRAIVALYKRIKIVQLYMDGLRGKYIRSKKRERAMSAILNGPETKKKEATYGTVTKKLAEYENREKRIKAELTKHFAVSPNLASRWPHELPETILYLVQRSNQLQADDSVAVTAERKRTKDDLERSRKAVEHAEKKERESRRLLDYYISVFGLKTVPADWDWSSAIMDNGREAQNLVDAAVSDMSRPMSQPDTLLSHTFPWKRGNPGYLEDYTTEALLHEVEHRMAMTEQENRLLREKTNGR